MIEITKNSDNLAEQLQDIPREDLFTVDGFVGTIPAYVTPGVMLTYNRTRLNNGEDFAITWAMELLIGSEGMNRLIASGCSDEQLDQIITIIIGRVRGATRGEPGKGGSKRSASRAAPSRRRSPATVKSS
jgi:hypothetical protein